MLSQQRRNLHAPIELELKQQSNGQWLHRLHFLDVSQFQDVLYQLPHHTCSIGKKFNEYFTFWVILLFTTIFKIHFFTIEKSKNLEHTFQYVFEVVKFLINVQRPVSMLSPQSVNSKAI